MFGGVVGDVFHFTVKIQIVSDVMVDKGFLPFEFGVCMTVWVFILKTGFQDLYKNIEFV
jgi:hypothetical protein